jgi:hypothetical protein
MFGRQSYARSCVRVEPEVRCSQAAACGSDRAKKKQSECMLGDRRAFEVLEQGEQPPYVSDSAFGAFVM